MNTEDLINSLSEIVGCWRRCNDPLDSANTEITYWRKRFLSEVVGLPESLAQEIFISMPSNDFMLQSPEEHLEDLTKMGY